MGKNVSDDNNQEKKRASAPAKLFPDPWLYFCQFFCLFAENLHLVLKIHFPKLGRINCSGISCDSTGLVLPSKSLWTSYFSQKRPSLCPGSDHLRPESQKLITNSKLEPLYQTYTKITFLSARLATLGWYARRHCWYGVCLRCDCWNYRFVEKTTIQSIC